MAEGAATASALVQLIEKTNRAYRRELSYPIIFGVKEILEGKRTPAEGLRCITYVTLNVVRSSNVHVPPYPSSN